MKKSNFSSLIILFFLLVITRQAVSQCSDAGVCVISHKQNDSLGTGLSSITLGLGLGSSGSESDINGALNDLIFSSAKLEADLYLSKKSRLTIGIPYTIIDGPLGHNKGIGDLTVLYNHKFTIKKKHGLTISFGGKISVADVNTNDSLPQRYMPGLGTNDLIIGATYSYQYYSISAGYQKPFGRSANFVTGLKRGDDIFFRAGYSQKFNKILIKSEILTIIRIQESSVLVSGTTDTYTDIQGSNEPQVNLLASVGYIVNNNFLLSVEAAFPFLKRNYNYDGLKRSFTVSTSLSYLFKL